ncbi:MAG: flagellar hook-associated protein FlgK [Lachnospiraceae bacterium]
MIRATFSGFSTALSALQANQKRLDVTGQNLANMNTVGYTRQQLETSSFNYSNPISRATNGSAIAVGFGVSMDRVSQIRDPYLDIQYRSQINKSGYADSLQSSLDALSKILDESNIDGIRQAFDDIKSSLTSMQDPAKINDPIYESELRARMQALTNLLNSSAKQIETAEKNEFDKLEGQGTSEQGAIQRVNDILRQVGDLNLQIKKNQVLGQPSLELMDERNVLLDELASYLPIEITHFKDEEHSGIVTDGSGNPVLDANGNPRQKMYEYDAKGNVLGRKEWPDDVRIEMLYTDASGDPQRLTLVNGSEGGKDKNYGSLSLAAGDRDHPTEAAIQFTAAASSGGAETVASAADSQMKGGSIQASLDMLGKQGTGTLVAGTQTLDDVRGYQYYMNNLDQVAQTFAQIMNDINKDGVQGNPPINSDPYYLLVNKGSDDGSGITADNIGISSNWINGNTHIGMIGDNPNDTILNMLESMSKAHTNLGNKSFADYINNTSTILANDSSANINTLKTNITVLNSIQNSRDSVSGVSLDEEAANMMNYISAYSAASRLMTALDEALNTLITGTGLVGR